jgi:hypothetical protein
MPFFPFKSVSNKTIRLMEKAAKFNDRLDKIDEEKGNRLLYMEQPSGQPRTAICAPAAGMNKKDWDCVAQACCTVMRCEVLLRRLERKVHLDIREGKDPTGGTASGSSRPPPTTDVDTVKRSS